MSDVPLEHQPKSASTARLVESREIAPYTRHFVFEVPEVTRLDFTPGQFVSLSAPIHGNTITRAYSVSSPPDGNRFALCLNLVPEGKFSPLLFQMEPGETLDLAGPLGTFTLRKPIKRSIFVATGTGVAPFRSMLLAHLPEYPGTHFTLILGVRHEEGLLYGDELRAVELAHPNFSFLPTLTRPTPEWTGRSGRVQPHLFETIGDDRDLNVYVCGLKEMVDDVRRLLKERGFDRKQVVYEKYD